MGDIHAFMGNAAADEWANIAAGDSMPAAAVIEDYMAEAGEAKYMYTALATLLAVYPTLGEATRDGAWQRAAKRPRRAKPLIPHVFSGREPGGGTLAGGVFTSQPRGGPVRVAQILDGRCLK